MAEGLTNLQFVALCLLPITLIHDHKRPRVSAGILLTRLAAKMALTAAVVSVSMGVPGVPSILRNLLHAFGLYFVASSLMDGPGALLEGFMGRGRQHDFLPTEFHTIIMYVQKPN